MIQKNNEFTPGPWMWYGNSNNHEITLCTVGGGRLYIMDFVRWGMRAGQPRFQFTGTNQGMIDAKHLLKYEVGDRSITGVDEAKADPSVYRYDVIGIDNPNARLIASSPCLHGVVKELVESGGVVSEETLEKARGVLKRVEGGA